MLSVQRLLEMTRLQPEKAGIFKDKIYTNFDSFRENLRGKIEFQNVEMKY